MRLRQTIGVLAVGVMLCGVAACHHSPRIAPVVAPSVQLARALDLFHHGDFRRAQTMLQRLTFDLEPGDPTLPQIRYYLAECSFQMGDLIQAASDFRKVSDEFSTTDYAPMALLRAGDANLRLWHRPELDPSYGETALAIYQELAGRFPDSDAAARARVHVRRLEHQFAEKTYKTGMFYLRRKAFDSAIIYFKDVVAKYPEAPSARLAQLRLVDAYKAIRYKDDASDQCAELRRLFPDDAEVRTTCAGVALPAPSTADSTKATPPATGPPSR